jgi:hypothetical protein
MPPYVPVPYEQKRISVIGFMQKIAGVATHQKAKTNIHRQAFKKLFFR